MKRHNSFKASAAHAEQSRRHADALGLPRQIESPYLTSAECAAYLRFKSVAALYKAIPVDGIPALRCGNRKFLFHRADLDAWLRKGRAA